jgi:hypothetical protein
VAYADNAKPGDRFYFLDQWQEHLALKIPRSKEAEVRFRERMVTERLMELNELPVVNEVNQNVRLKAVERSQKNLEQAVDAASQIQENLRSKGKVEEADNVTRILNELEKLGEKQEKRVEEFKKNGPQEDASKFDLNIEAIKKARLKARGETNNNPLEKTQELEIENRLEFKGPPLPEIEN